MQVGLNYINKLDFLTAYIPTCREAMAVDTVRSGFAATGLVPYDPDQVLSKLNT